MTWPAILCSWINSVLLPMLNNTSTSSNKLNISLLCSCTIDCFAGAKVIKKVESEKREVKSEVKLAESERKSLKGAERVIFFYS